MNHIFSRLAIGTANWGKTYNGAKVSEDDQKKILDYCQSSGIDMIDTATAYEWDWTKISSYFNVVVKVKTRKDIDSINDNPYCIMSHNREAYSDLWSYGGGGGISIYEPSEIEGTSTVSIVQCPYSIYDRRFEKIICENRKKDIEIHVRSVFLRGKLLEKFAPWECIAFCLMNPHVGRVIIGVDSYAQLRDNLRIFHRMNSSEKHDINLLDLRRWQNERK